MSKKDTAEELVSLPGFALDAVGEIIVDRIAALLEQQHPNTAEALDDMCKNIVSPEKTTSILRTEFARAYMNHFSEDEIRQLKDFFEKGLGAKYLSVNAALYVDLAEASKKAESTIMVIMIGELEKRKLIPQFSQRSNQVRDKILDNLKKKLVTS